MPYQALPGEGYNHYFAIPPADVKPGKAVFAIRLYAPVLPPAILAAPEHFNIGPIPLAGEWQAKAEYSLPGLSPADAATAPKPPHQPPSLKASAIFNGVVHPIIPYGLAGILWYQGESNTGTAVEYRTVFPLFINDLREKWNQPRFPFYFCQLPNMQAKVNRPGESAWAEMRESQSLALQLPDTAQAVPDRSGGIRRHPSAGQSGCRRQVGANRARQRVWARRSRLLRTDLSNDGG